MRTEVMILALGLVTAALPLRSGCGEEREVVSVKEPEVLAACTVPNDVKGCRSWNVTYMGYDAITSDRSYQWRFERSGDVHTDEETGIRVADGRYLIAIGTGYLTEAHLPSNLWIGRHVDVCFPDGNVLPCIVGDIKSDVDTDEETHRYCVHDGSVIEFIVDYGVFRDREQYARLIGDWIEEIHVLDDFIYVDQSPFRKG